MKFFELIVALNAVINNALNACYDTSGAFGPVGDVPWRSLSAA